MASRDIPLESWEAVVPGVVFPLLALWLGGSTWGARGTAAAANLAPLVVLAILTRWAGRRAAAVQGAATVAYGITAAGWVGATWDVPFLAGVGTHAGLWTPLVAAGLGAVVMGAVRAAFRLTGDVDGGLAGEA